MGNRQGALENLGGVMCAYVLIHRRNSMKQTVMITGNKGYIGTVMTASFKAAGYAVVGYDSEFFGDCSVSAPPACDRQIIKDIRDAQPSDFAGIDHVVHLAGLSNDPMGELNPSLTDQINHHASVHLARTARAAGVSRFLYASSQSVYGLSPTTAEIDETGPGNPITEYAKTKWESEIDLFRLGTPQFTVCCLRPATAYGASPLLRLDLVLNQFVAHAYVKREIRIMSDGSPWRPLTHVQDISGAFLACLLAPKELVANQSYNVGTDNNNYTVRQLAEVVQAHIPGTSLTFTGEHTDSRSYRVSSHKILTQLKAYYQPHWDIEAGVLELMRFYEKIGMNESMLASSRCIRIKRLKERMEEGTLDAALYSTGSNSGRSLPV